MQEVPLGEAALVEIFSGRVPHFALQRVDIVTFRGHLLGRFWIISCIFILWCLVCSQGRELMSYMETSLWGKSE